MSPTDNNDDANNPPIDFHHPYTPYDVQLEFMHAVYSVLEAGNGQVGILESPTGTVNPPPPPQKPHLLTPPPQGKSLSLICSTLTWLRNHKRARFSASFDAVAATLAGEPDWMIETALRRKRAELARGWEEREAKLKALRAKERAMEERGRAGKRQRVGGEDGGGGAGKREVDEEREFLIQEWRDDDEGRAGDDPLGMLGRETRELLERVGMGGRKGEEEEEEGVEEEVKVCFLGWFWWWAWY